VNVTVSAANDGPAAIGDSYTTPHDTELAISSGSGVLANDRDIDGDLLTAAIAEQPAHGTLSLADHGGFTYQPHAGYSGTDTFTYRAIDAAAASDPATVHTEVQSAHDLAAYVLQPIYRDASGTFSVKRGVVPVKFELIDNGAATCGLPEATIRLTRLDGTDPGTIDESVYLQPADTGNTFRVSDCYYIYNLAAKQLSPGTYEVAIVNGNSPIGTARFSLA
jgi:hypothetical protein